MLKTRLKSYSFWVSFASAVILILKLIGQKYGFTIDAGFLSDLVTAVCGLLVILGIFVVPKNNIAENSQNENNLKNTNIEDDSALDLNSNSATSLKQIDLNTNLFTELIGSTNLFQKNNTDSLNTQNKNEESQTIKTDNNQINANASCETTQNQTEENSKINFDDFEINNKIENENNTNSPCIANLNTDCDSTSEVKSISAIPLKTNQNLETLCKSSQDTTAENLQNLNNELENNLTNNINNNPTQNNVTSLDFAEKVANLIEDELKTSTKNSADIKILLKKIIDNIGE